MTLYWNVWEISQLNILKTKLLIFLSKLISPMSSPIIIDKNSSNCSSQKTNKQQRKPHNYMWAEQRCTAHVSLPGRTCCLAVESGTSKCPWLSIPSESASAIQRLSPLPMSAAQTVSRAGWPASSDWKRPDYFYPTRYIWD